MLLTHTALSDGLFSPRKVHLRFSLASSGLTACFSEAVIILPCLDVQGTRGPVAPRQICATESHCSFNLQAPGDMCSLAICIASLTECLLRPLVPFQSRLFACLSQSFRNTVWATALYDCDFYKYFSLPCVLSSHSPGGVCHSEEIFHFNESQLINSVFGRSRFGILS